MKNQDKTNEELLKEILELRQENQSLKAISTKYISDQKQVEDAFQDSESKYRCLFDSANDAIFLMDKDVFIDCNPKTLEMFGCAMDQIIGHPPYEFSPEKQSDGRDSMEKAEEYITEAYNGVPQLFEWTHLTYDGRPFFAEVSLNSYQIGDHKYLQAIVRDITQRKQIEREIQESHEDLNITLKSIGDAVIVADVDGLITYLNPVAENLTGWNFIDAKGQPLDSVFKIINAVTRRRVENPFATVVKTGKIVGLANHTILQSLNGAEYQVADSAAPLLDYVGHIRGVVLVFRDVTEDYLKEEKLRKSEQQYRELFENSRDGYVAFTHDGTITKCNDQFLNMINYSLAEATSLNINDITPECWHATELDVLKKQVSVRGYSKLYEKEFIRKDGTIVPVEIQTYHSLDDQGLHTSYWSFVRNITKRKQNQQALLESEQLYRTIFENTGTAGIIIEEDTIISLANNEWVALSGYSHEELEGKMSWTQFVVEEDLDRMMGYHYQRREDADDVPRKYEFRFVRKNGEIRDVINTVAMIPGTKKSIASMMDITDRRKVEKALMESEENHRLLLELAPDAFFQGNEQGYFINGNKRATSLTGYSKEELLTMKATELFTPVLLNQKPLRFDLLDKGETIIVEREIVRKDGTTRIVEMNSRKMPNNTYQTFARDITERKHAEKILQDIIAQNPISIQIVNAEGYTVHINPSHTRLFGTFPPPDYSVFNDFQLIKQGFGDLLEQAKKGEVVHFPDMFYNVHDFDPIYPDNPIWVQLVVFPIYDNVGKLEQYVLMHENITERKLAEEALRKSNELVSLFMKYSPIYAFIKEVTSTESRVLMASENFIKMVGVSGTEMKGKTMHELFPADLASQITKDDWNVVSSSQMLEIDEELDGRYYHTIKFPIIYGDKNLLAGYTIDVTDNKKTEEILKQNEEEITRQNGLFTSLLKNLTQGVFMVEAPSGKPLMANEAALKLLGRGILPDVTKENLSEVYKAYKIDKNTPYPIEEMPIVKGMSGISSYIDDMLVVRPDGTETFLEIFGTPVINRQGQIWASLVSFSDITERKKAEVALSESEARFKTIFMKSPMGISLSDSLTGQILQANPRYAEIVGRTHEEVLSLNWMDITHPDDVLVDQEKNALLLQGAIPGYQMEKRYIHPDGSLVWVNMTIVPLSEELYDHPHNLCMIEDITDKKKYEMELIKAKERAEESDRLKSAFLANVSHEIRTPMNGIIGFAELLKEPDISGDDLHEYVGIIEKSGVRMLNIINDIIDISKIESGLMKITISKTNVNEQVDYSYKFFKPEAENKGISLIVNSEYSNAEAYINTDREKLYAIITNLVKNSIKYTHEGVIEMGYSLIPKEGKTELQFYVKDTGIGIAKDRQNAIFERFIQADVTDTRSFQGAGLGLAITKAYVEMLGGKIWLESEEGKGSEFYFTLPSLPDTELKMEDHVADSIEESGSHEIKLKILIVEDDETSELLIEKDVKKYTREILNVGTGEEAVEICRNQPDIDLILMDIQMPVMDGYTAVRKIREFNKDVVIYAQTAYALSGDREKALKAGCNDYLTKPISKEVLLGMIQANF